MAVNEKPMDVKVRDTVLRIIERALFYNNTKTEQELTSGKPTFLYVLQDIRQLYMSIYTQTAGTRAANREGFDIYLSESEYNGTADEIQSELVSVLKRMEEVYTTWYEKENPNE